MRRTLSQNTVYRRDRPNSGWSMCILFAVIMLFGAKVSADQIGLLFLVSKPTKDYLNIMTTVQDELNKTFPDKYKYTVEFVSQRPATQKTGFRTTANADLIVTVGTAAADSAYGERALEPKPLESKALQAEALQPNSFELSTLEAKAQQYKITAPIVSVLITDSSFAALARKHFGSVNQAFAHQVSAISIDQPTSRSIRLAKLLLPKAKKAGVMLGYSSAAKQQELAESISDLGMTSEFVTIGTKDNPITKIDPVIGDADVFIPVPDSRLINIATARWILRLSYRHKVPVVAFSRTYVEAGALAAIYSSPQNVALQTVEWIADADLDGGDQGQAYQPKYFSMHFNYSVAASLDVVIKDEQFYRDKLHGGNR